MAMRRIAVFTISLVLFSTVSLSSALAGAPELLPASSTDLGYQLMHFKYEEPGLMKETGFMHGLFLRHTIHTDSELMLRGEMELSFGSLDYDGQYQDGTPITRETDDYLYAMRGVLGKDFLVNDYAVTPFIGLGYRYWNDTIRGAGGYEREISQWYAPLGVEVARVAGDWRVAVRGEYDLFLGGTVKSHLDQAVAGLNTVTNNQDFGKGYGLRASLSAERSMDGGWTLGFEPFVRWWDIKKSDTSTVTFLGQPVAYGWEPKNETLASGLRVYLNF